MAHQNGWMGRLMPSTICKIDGQPERGTYYSRAIADCKQAAEGMIPAEVAKESFISAAIEAHVYAH